MIAEQQINQWTQIVAKAWQDEAFKTRLVANPSAILKEQGIELPVGVQVRVVENTDQVVHLTLPAQPGSDELSESDLDAVAGGFWGAIAAAAQGPKTTCTPFETRMPSGNVVKGESCITIVK